MTDLNFMLCFVCAVHLQVHLNAQCTPAWQAECTKGLPACPYVLKRVGIPWCKVVVHLLLQCCSSVAAFQRLREIALMSIDHACYHENCGIPVAS